MTSAHNVATYSQMANALRALNSIENAQTHLSGQVADVSARQEQTRSDLTALRDIVDEFIRRDILEKSLQFAQTKLIDVRAQLATEFGHYGEVRRLATGLLQATDAGIVTTATMRDLSEELMLTAPRYWLAPAVVALAAWIRDDKVIADRAVAEALRRDNDKTALLFALVLRRHQRTGATARWLYQYVARQDPNSLGREFVVVLDAVSTGALGQEARPLVLEHVDEWYRAVNEQDDVREAQITRWMELLDSERGGVGSHYTVLPEVSESWPALKSLYEGATIHGLSLARLVDLYTGDVRLSHDQHRRVDDILQSLVTNYDVEELPARREEAELELIVKHDGDKAAARRELSSTEQAHDERVDVLTLLTNAAFFPERMGASKGTQRLATALAHEWIDDANSRLRDRNRRQAPADVKLAIEGWRSSIDDTATEASLHASLENHIDRETAAAVAAVRFTGGPLFAAVAAVLLGVLGIALIASGSAGGGVFLLLVAAGAGGFSGYNYAQLPKRREALRQHGERRKVAGRAKLNGAIAETMNIRREWQAESAKAKDLHEFVAQLTPSSFSVRASDEQRGIAR